MNEKEMYILCKDFPMGLMAQFIFGRLTEAEMIMCIGYHSHE